MNKVWEKLMETSIEVLEENCSRHRLEVVLRNIKSKTPLNMLVYEDVNKRCWIKFTPLTKIGEEEYSIKEENLNEVVDCLEKANVKPNSIRFKT